MDPILSPNLMRNGHTVNAVPPVTGSIDPGSTIRPFAGTTRIFLTSNPHQVIFLMSTLLHCHTQHFRVWGTQGWQLVLPAIQSLPIWEACENYEYALRLEEQ